MSNINYKNNPYPGMIENDDPCFRFTDKSLQANERMLFDNWWREQINLFGQKIEYYVNTYNVLSANNFYGEETVKKFADPRPMVIGITLNENAITLSRHGFISDDDITAFVHISSFYDTFYTLSSVYDTQFNIVEPKAGDVFNLTEYGSTRPDQRQGKYFEITEKLDQDISQINQLAGHYVFLIKAKRLDYSFEPNIPFNNENSNIKGNEQVYDGSFSGRLSGGENPPTESKRENYSEYSIDNISKEIFDYIDNNDDVYGDY